MVLVTHLRRSTNVRFGTRSFSNCINDRRVQCTNFDPETILCTSVDCVKRECRTYLHKQAQWETLTTTLYYIETFLRHLHIKYKHKMRLSSSALRVEYYSHLKQRVLQMFLIFFRNLPAWFQVLIFINALRSVFSA